ncbi:hypothetical protein LSCM1_04744 [Leishmania martiniquensis]|uniref:Uncharacterized protein n=1 Tax=Leishmania martiniquensis TaxID=1580590 RepID=A0A836KQY2_9TRYP|nr:hypothetical protein LSCM1_04744 [Leishmania martiniquensis]
MMRFRGTHCKQLLAQLPRNLLIFDGHCLLCQARVRYVLERNFSFFGLLDYAAGEVEDAMAKGLDLHRIHFASFDSAEGENLRRFFFQRAPSSSPARPPRTLSMPDDLVLLFIEKVPSQTASSLAAARRSSVAADDQELFRSTTTKATGSLSSTIATSTTSFPSETASARLVDAAETDLLVSTNYMAMCRVGMHLDRFLTRLFFRFLHGAVPASVGDWWFQRFVCRRRKLIWGTSEQDAVMESGIVEGMRERRWAWRGGSSSALRR